MRANRELHTFSDPLYATFSFEKRLGTEATATKTGPLKEVLALMPAALAATLLLAPLSVAYARDTTASDEDIAESFGRIRSHRHPQQWHACRKDPDRPRIAGAALKIDVEIDDGPLRETDIDPKSKGHSWTLFRYSWNDSKRP